MERTKYKQIINYLIIIFMLTGGHVVSAMKSQTTNDATQSQTMQNSSGTTFRQQIYQAYISGKMSSWKTVIDAMEKQKNYQPDFLTDLINYQYGYVAWCLGNNKKAEATEILSLLDENLRNLKKAAGETADYHAYSAAAYGFKIGLNLWRAPFLGPRSMGHAEKALRADNLNIQANIELGNIWNYMPAIFGGSPQKALNYFLKALEGMEKESAEVRKNNWMYLNLLTMVGQKYKELGDKDQARIYFEKAIQAEPDFIWVKKGLLPSLEKIN
ncbi:MAG: hypothetical protein PHU98_08290 [Mariniphaga sp.]|nr:hypothetical protein [Mariniphaga sp.]